MCEKAVTQKKMAAGFVVPEGGKSIEFVFLVDVCQTSGEHNQIELLFLTKRILFGVRDYDGSGLLRER